MSPIYGARARTELRQFFRQREAMIFTVVFPPLLFLIIGFILDYDNAPDLKFTPYFLAGMIAAGALAASFQNLAIMIPLERDAGLLKRLRGTPMPGSAYFFGKIVLVLSLVLIELVLLLAIAVLVFGITLPTSATKWAVFAGVLLLGTTACTLAGIAFSSLAPSGHGASAIATPVSLLLQFISGVFFTLESIPAWLRAIAEVFPLKHMAAGLRYVFLPESAASLEPGDSWNLVWVFAALAIWCVLGLALCMKTFRWRDREDG